MMPVTRARISTSREPSAWPTASSEIGTGCAFTLSVPTCTAGVDAAGAAPLALLPQPARSTAGSARAAKAETARKRGLGLIGRGTWNGREGSGYYRYVLE